VATALPLAIVLVVTIVLEGQLAPTVGAFGWNRLTF
jgi:hypothetical protein